MSAQPTKDHNGVEYESFSAMCKAYGLPNTTVKNRLARNWSLEEALTIPNESTGRKKNYAKEWEDHLGNKYNSVREMCENYGISEKVFWSRKRLLKWPLKKILTTPLKDIPETSIEITDHLGNTFRSISDLCRYHKIGLSTFRERRKLGWSIEKALTTPKKNVSMKRKKCIDHLGNQYASLNEMCRHYGLSRYTFSSRLELGWGLEKALTTPYVIAHKTCVDYNNQTFPTLKDMANYYYLPAYALQGVNDDKDIAKVLIEKIKNRFKNVQIKNIHVLHCVKFPYFMIREKNHKSIMHIDEILDVYHNTPEFKPLPATKVQNDTLKIVKVIRFPYYLVELNHQTIVWSYWNIIDYNLNSNFGLLKQEDK